MRAATLLRTHTSAMQIRYMKTFPPPVRIIVPGRVYRRDNLDLSHTPMFQQFEGLVVGQGVTMADLKGTFEAMLRELFGDVKVRPAPELLPLHRTERRGGHHVSELRRLRAVARASTPAGSRFWAAAWCIPPCSKRWATTPRR